MKTITHFNHFYEVKTNRKFFNDILFERGFANEISMDRMKKIRTNQPTTSPND